MPADGTASGRRRVVIVGGGFGGFEAAHRLKKANVDVTVVDRKNHHLFQPLIYQVAAGALSEGDVAAPVRAMLKRQPNAAVLMEYDVSPPQLGDRSCSTAASDSTTTA